MWQLGEEIVIPNTVPIAIKWDTNGLKLCLEMSHHCVIVCGIIGCNGSDLGGRKFVSNLVGQENVTYVVHNSHLTNDPK